MFCRTIIRGLTKVERSFQFSCDKISQRINLIWTVSSWEKKYSCGPLLMHYVLFERLALYTNMSMWHYCGTLLKSTLLNKDWNACSEILAKWSQGYIPWLLLKNHVPQRPSHVCPIGFKNVMRKNLPHPQSYTVHLLYEFVRTPAM